jgi:hypothetical protein
MAPTISSQQARRDKADRPRKALGDTSTRDVPSSRFTTEPVNQPPSVVQAEEKKLVSLRIKAKRSIRNLFPKKKISFEAPDTKTNAGLTITSIVEQVKAMPNAPASAARSCKVAEVCIMSVLLC